MSIDESMGVQVRTGGALVEQAMQHAMAEAQVKLLVAKRFPRDEMQALDRILQACTRKGLAETAIYAYPRGDSMVTGPSIRLAEEVARQWGNMDCGIRELSQQNGVSEVEAYAWDTQTNTRKSMVFHVKHWRDTKRGGYALTDSRDIYELVANQGARRLRACILAVVPDDVIAEAEKQCLLTQENSVGAPAEVIESMVTAFADSYGVTREQIVKRLRHKVESVTAAEVLALKRVYQAIRDGMGKVADYFEAEEGAAAEPGTPAPETKVNAAAALAAKVRADREAAKKPPKPPAETKQEPAKSGPGAAQGDGEASPPPETDQQAPAGAGEAVDPDTGEVTGTPPLSQAKIMDMVEKAGSNAELDAAADLARALPSHLGKEVWTRVQERRREVKS